MSFDLARTVRAIKPQRLRPLLARRGRDELSWVDDETAAGAPLLLDTTVYIDIMASRSPREVGALLTSRVCNHSTVVVAELTHAFGRLDPAHRKTKAELLAIADAIHDIPARRLFSPDESVWGGAGMLAGAFRRLSGAPPEAPGRRMLNDALLYLQARKLGCALLSANVRDFDFLQQLAPDGRMIFYRSA